jgi:hypothetical protein
LSFLPLRLTSLPPLTLKKKADFIFTPSLTPLSLSLSLNEKLRAKTRRG